MEIKIAVFIVLISVTNLFASNTYSQVTRVTIDMENNTLEKVMDEIERQSEFYFIFNQKQIDVNRIVTVQGDNVKIDEVLDGIFDGTDVFYSFLDRKILLATEPLEDEIKAYKEVSEMLQDVIRGTVTDSETGEPMVGVNVQAKGTTIGSITDVNGEYTMPATVASDATLVFSFIGYKAQEVPIAGRQLIDVQLVPELLGLDEVVVIGYGTIKKSDLTGSVGSVDNTVLQQVKVPDVLSAIGGRVAGVQIMSTTGDAPGSSPTVRIRGVGSISAESTPLYVIDGFPTDNMDLLNPNDIESIDILKDASATAIYGSRGANGVVIINTRRGEAGKANIVFETYQGLQKIAKKMDLLTMEEQAYYYYYGIRNENLDAGNDVSGDPLNWPYRVPLTVMNVINGTQSDLYPSVPFNMLDAITKIGHIQSYQLMASGGSEGLRYSISGEYLNEEGVVIETPFERYSLRVNLDGKLSEKLDLSLSTHMIYGENHGIDVVAGGWRGGGLIGQATTWELWYPGYNNDGSYFVCYGIDASNNRDNPLAWLKEYDAGRNRFRVMTNVALDYKIFDDLTLSQRVGVNQNYSHSFEFRPQMEVFANAVARGSDSRSASLNWLSETTLNYKKIIDRHDFTGLLGFTSQKQHNESNYLRSSSFPNNLVYTLNAASNVLDQGNSEISEWSLVSYLARITYSYDSKYLLTASIRTDGSSRFGSERKFGYFPSVALAWRISQEDFMSAVNFLSDAKLRISYGETGNNNIGNYTHISTIDYNSAIIGGIKVGGYEPARFPNPILTWEKQRSLNFGVDVGLFKDRITANIDYFYTRNHQLLLDVYIPQITGFNTALQNIGEVENKGWELTVNSRNLVGDFGWTTDFNISSFKNKVLKLGPEGAPIISSRHITQIGQPIGMFYGYKIDGIFVNQAELDAGPIYNPGQYDESRLGDIRFVDVSGPDGVPDGIINTYDRTIIGNPYPDFFYGMTNQFSYKNINLTVGLRGVVGGGIMSQTDFYLYTRARYRQYASQRNYWLSEAEPGDGVTPRPNNNPKGGNRQASDRHIDTAQFLKVHLINLSYTLPDRLANLLTVSSIRSYLNVNNAFTFTKNQSYNPEISSYSSSLEPAVDADDYPIVTDFTIGLQVTF